MDPNANLAEQLQIARRILADSDQEPEWDLTDAERLAELVIALDDWIRTGGFPPSRQ